MRLLELRLFHHNFVHVALCCSPAIKIPCFIPFRILLRRGRGGEGQIRIDKITGGKSGLIKS